MPLFPGSGRGKNRKSRNDSLGIVAAHRYNAVVTAHRNLPEAGHVSIATVAVLLAYALTRVIKAPEFPVDLSLGGIRLAFNLNLDLAFAILAAGLAASGMDWLLHDHPLRKSGRAIQHWLLPLITALVIGVALSTLPSNWIWWLGFGVGGLLLVVVFLAEYIAVDPTDPRYPLASMALVAFSFSLYLILATTLRSAGVRLLLMIPALFSVALLTSLHTLYLRLGEKWEIGWSAGIALIGTQLAVALHYWPLTPIRFGLLLLGPIYALPGLAVNLLEDVPIRRAVIEPAIMLGLIWGLSVGIH